MNGILLLATVVLIGVGLSLYQIPASGLILLHINNAKKYPRRITALLEASYILGAITTMSVFALAARFLSQRFTSFFENSDLFTSVTCGILFAYAFIMLLLYYRKSASTETWIPHSIARLLNIKTKNARNILKSFAFGGLFAVVELPLSFCLYLIAGKAMAGANSLFTAMMILCLVLPSLFHMSSLGKKLDSQAFVRLQKQRIAHARSIRIFACITLISLSFFLIAFREIL